MKVETTHRTSTCGMACRSNTIAKTCNVKCKCTANGQTIDRERLLGYQFDPLIHRMVDKHGWNEAEARQGFEDLKAFLFKAASTEKGQEPTAMVDDLWHNFILFTEDYEEFCLTTTGAFLHHRPTRRDE